MYIYFVFPFHKFNVRAMTLVFDTSYNFWTYWVSKKFN